MQAHMQKHLNDDGMNGNQVSSERPALITNSRTVVRAGKRQNFINYKQQKTDKKLSSAAEESDTRSTV